jgi:hypothetical protein
MHHSRLSPVLWISFVVLALLAGCGRVDGEQDAGAELAAAPESSTVVLATTPTLTGPELDATKMAPYYEERRQVAAHATSFALGTPYPTLRPRPEQSPLPMMTPLLGLSGECADANRYFDYARCWAGLVGNEYVFVSAGGIKGEQVQGAVKVYTQTLDLLTFGERVTYPAPRQVGKLTITDVAWPLMTLIAFQDDPATAFVLDLATRQWVSSTLTPAAATATLTGPELDATKAVILRGPVEDQQTRVAQATAFAQGTPYPYTPWARPTQPTSIPPALGIHGNCAQGNKRFDYGGCWTGVVNGEYMFVVTGAGVADWQQGVVIVYTRTLDLRTEGPLQRYSTPLRRGVVRPIQVTWPLMTLLAKEDNSTQVFDLATRQWISPPSTPGPSPSALISPVPSGSPKPTQSP